MPDKYTKYNKIIQEAIDAKNFKLALKFWKEMNKRAEASNNKYGLKTCKELKKKLDDEIIYEKALKIFKKAKIEYKNNNYNTALTLFYKAKSYMIKSEIIKNEIKIQMLREIDDTIYDINQKSNVQFIVYKLLLEKDEEKINKIVEELGKIAKQDIELIALAIDLLLKMVDSEDENTKFKAIKGLGEVTAQRPEWAYIGISKLIEIMSTDENDDARIMALMELSRVGQENTTMLIEHLVSVINALRDPNQHVRRWAAYAINVMAEVIPLEVKEAIPALRESLHDKYSLVRQFSEKALTLIRAAVRTIE